MAGGDRYSAGFGKRCRKYRAAYASPEARAWIAGLSPAEREKAQRLGLLEPLVDDGGSASGPAFDTPRRDVVEAIDSVMAQPFCNLDGNSESPSAIPAEGWIAVFRDMKPGDAFPEEARAFLEQGGNPRLRWACVCFLLGRDSCAKLARSVGMSKQAFHYHVRQLQKQLGLPPMGKQKCGKARRSYRLANRRKARAAADFDTEQ